MCGRPDGARLGGEPEEEEEGTNVISPGVAEVKKGKFLILKKFVSLLSIFEEATN
jgi:hypothetical protein